MSSFYLAFAGLLAFLIGAGILGLWLRKHQSRENAERASRIMHGLFFAGLVAAPLVGLVYPGYIQIDHLVGIPSLPMRPVFLVIGILLLLPGLYLLAISNQLLRVSGEGANAFRLTRHLVGMDIYARSRNPMSLGFYLCSLGLALITGSTLATLGSLLGTIPAHLFFLKFFEERELQIRFGESYMEYKRKVPFLIPRKRATWEQGMTRSRSLGRYLLVVFALSIPLWLAGSFIGLEIVPGVPLSSVVVTFCPAIAAAIAVYRAEKWAGVRVLLKRTWDFGRVRSRVWYVPALLLMPAVMTVEYWLLRRMGLPIPPPRFPLWMPLAMFAAYFIAALGEELGWTGYAADPLQERLSALPAALVLGVIWAAWHILPVVQVGRSPLWIAWQCLFWISARVIIFWLYNNTGKSVFAVLVFHSMLNVSSFLFPVEGSFYDPRITALIVTGLALIVVLVWGPRTLTKDRAGDAPPHHTPSAPFVA